MEAGDPLDTAHGFAHIDRYNLRGRAKKERLALSFSEALTRAARLKDEKEAFELIGASTFKVDPESVQTINA